jgi:hypothetical protein
LKLYNTIAFLSSIFIFLLNKEYFFQNTRKLKSIKEQIIMKIYSYPQKDSLFEALETYSEDAYIFCAPETID